MSDLSWDDRKALMAMASADRPLFGGPFARGVATGDEGLERLCLMGLVKRAHRKGVPVGYVITEAGRRAIPQQRRCPNCGHAA